MQGEHVGHKSVLACEIHLDVVFHNRVVGQIDYRGQLGQTLLIFGGCGGGGVAGVDAGHHIILEIEVFLQKTGLGLEALGSYYIVVSDGITQFEY